MARIREKTLKFPGLDNTYTFADEADLFDASVDCVAGKCYIYAGDLYRCKNDHSGAWDADDFVLTKLGNEIYDLKTTIDDMFANSVVTIHLEDLEMEQKGYISDQGIFISPQNGSHKIVKMDASKLRYVSFKSNDSVANGSFAILKDSSDETLALYGPIGTAKVEYEITPQDGNVLYISFMNGQKTTQELRDTYYSTIEVKNYDSPIMAYEEEVEGIVDEVLLKGLRYNTCANKPYDFDSKSCLFFGDSITFGYIAESGGTPAHQATNNYPKVFSEAVGATYSNKAEAGASLATVSGYASIYDKIQNTTLNSDFVFVSGGVNDWQLGVSEADLEDAVTDICDYLTANYSGDVIWITPINEAGRVTIETPAQSLQNVRNVITRVALKYGYSVVQGWEFPFPIKGDDSDYIDLMFQDKLHPTELGYSMYAQALRSALC